MNISIIGAGKLGTCLGYALAQKGHRIQALSSRHLSSAVRSSKIIGQGRPLANNIPAACEGKIIFLCLPDEEIVKVAKELSRADLRWAKKIVYHCSGLLSSRILKPLKDQGAAIASFHPIQSFSKKEASAKEFKGIYFGLEGDKEALDMAQKIVRQLGGHTLLLKEKDKALYHAACSIASNFLVVLLDMATALLKQTGLREEKTLECLLPLVEGTLRNVNKSDTRAALTGPIARGDSKSVQKHLRALEKFPLYKVLYKKLAAHALEMAGSEKLPHQKIRALKKMLGYK
jgi:predicted short-subunit dehydrogenase-like oxidoreductase (DUF2520 family)